MNVSQVFSKLVSSQKSIFSGQDLIETDCAYHGRSAADKPVSAGAHGY